MGHGVLDMQHLSRHQNKEWAGYSRLERRSERESALLKQQTKTTCAEIEHVQSTRYTRVGHGMLHVQLQFSATEWLSGESGSFC